jgi:hypothetical protein
MAFSNEELELFQEHLRNHTKLTGCPECGSEVWAMHGPVALLDYGFRLPPGLTIGRPGNTPVVALLCGQCFYLKLFAWWPIKQGDADKKLPPAPEDASGG